MIQTIILLFILSIALSSSIVKAQSNVEALMNSAYYVLDKNIALPTLPSTLSEAYGFEISVVKDYAFLLYRYTTGPSYIAIVDLVNGTYNIYSFTVIYDGMDVLYVPSTGYIIVLGQQGGGNIDGFLYNGTSLTHIGSLSQAADVDGVVCSQILMECYVYGDAPAIPAITYNSSLGTIVLSRNITVPSPTGSGYWGTALAESNYLAIVDSNGVGYLLNLTSGTVLDSFTTGTLYNGFDSNKPNLMYLPGINISVKIEAVAGSALLTNISVNGTYFTVAHMVGRELFAGDQLVMTTKDLSILGTATPGTFVFARDWNRQLVVIWYGQWLEVYRYSPPVGGNIIMMVYETSSKQIIPYTTIIIATIVGISLLYYRKK